MDSKNRLAIAIAITCLIVVAMFASFGRSLFLVNIPSVSLAHLDEDTSNTDGSSTQGQDDQFWQVDVTPETVQSIVASLSRPESYYRELTVDTLWNGGSHSTSVQFWQDGGWSHTRQVLPPGQCATTLPVMRPPTTGMRLRELPFLPRRPVFRRPHSAHSHLRRCTRPGYGHHRPGRL